MARRKSERVVSAEKPLVERVRQFFEEERRAKNRISLNRVTDRLVAATGLGKTTLAKIHTEFLSSQQFQTPQRKHVKREHRLTINVDDFDRAAIRRTVHDMYEIRHYPTSDKLLVRVRVKGVFPGGRTTLFRLMKEMGFRHTLRDGKLYFYERRDIMEQRHNYLKKLGSIEEKTAP